MRDSSKTILVILLLVLCIAIAGRIDFDSEVREGGAILNNGNRIEAVVVEDVVEDEVTVKLGHNYYVFYGNGFNEGEVICIEITSHDEIINAWR